MKKKLAVRNAVTLTIGLFMIVMLGALSLPPKGKPVKFDKIMGADISFLPSLEDGGRKFYDNGIQKDAFQLLKDHGFNYIRLRIFNNPRADSGYSKKGYCDLQNTLVMAKRIKAAGMGFLLDFHYSDNWADPGKQFKPAAWKQSNFQQLQDSIRTFTKKVISALKQQGTLPDMVQVGNEINHGMLWPDGRNKNMDTLSAFLRAGIAGVKDVDKKPRIMIHIACGGQNTESRVFIDNILKRRVKFDVIGQSYYPEWHGTPDSLRNNITDLSTRYKQDVIVVEYSQKKQEVNDIAFSLPGSKLKGTFIWEPFSWGETVIDKAGKSNDYLKTYSAISQKYQIPQK